MNKKCIKCGKIIPEDAKYCPFCGSDLKISSQKKSKKQKSEPSRKPSSSRNNFIYMVALISIIITAIYGYKYFIPPENQHVHTHQMNPNQPRPIDQNKLNKLKAQLNANPNGVAENVNLGNFLFDNQRYEEALIYYNKAIELDGKNPDVIVDAGVCYFNLRNFNESIKYFEKALKINPKHPNALYNLGIVKSQTGDMQGMLEAWNTLIKVAPESGPAHKAKLMVDQIKRSQTSN